MQKKRKKGEVSPLTKEKILLKKKTRFFFFFWSVHAPTFARTQSRVRAEGAMASLELDVDGIDFAGWHDEATQMKPVMRLIEKDLSEPYSIFTYRYFINNFPNLCRMAYDVTPEGMRAAAEASSGPAAAAAAARGLLVGVIVCKAQKKRGAWHNGYIAMLAVDSSMRGKGIGSQLVIRAVNEMQRMGCVEVILETEMANKAALSLYQNLGFVRETRLEKYYLNGGAAFRLKLWLPKPAASAGAHAGGCASSPEAAAAAAADAAAKAADAGGAAAPEVEEELVAGDDDADGLPPLDAGVENAEAQVALGLD